jgi:AcrR family transcriptional regulator
VPRIKESEKDNIRSHTRQLLLQAAIAEFAREGYKGANINRISMNAGFAKGTIYNYFTSKRDLMYTLIDEIASGHLKFMTEQVHAETDPVKRLRRFFEAGFSWVTANLPQGRLLFATLNGADQDFKVRMFEAYRPMFQLVADDILKTGMERGLFRQVEPGSTAGLIMTIYLGTGSQVDEQGQQWFLPGMVSDFVFRALKA